MRRSKRLEQRRIAAALTVSAAVWACAPLFVSPAASAQESYRTPIAEAQPASYQQFDARQKWTPPAVEAPPARRRQASIQEKSAQENSPRQRDDAFAAAEATPVSARADESGEFLEPFDAEPIDDHDGERRALKGFAIGCLTCIALFASWRLLGGGTRLRDDVEPAADAAAVESSVGADAASESVSSPAAAGSIGSEMARELQKPRDRREPRESRDSQPHSRDNERRRRKRLRRRRAEDQSTAPSNARAATSAPHTPAPTPTPWPAPPQFAYGPPMAWPQTPAMLGYAPLVPPAWPQAPLAAMPPTQSLTIQVGAPLASPAPQIAHAVPAVHVEAPGPVAPPPTLETSPPAAAPVAPQVPPSPPAPAVVSAPRVASPQVATPPASAPIESAAVESATFEPESHVSNPFEKRALAIVSNASQPSANEALIKVVPAATRTASAVSPPAVLPPAVLPPAVSPPATRGDLFARIRDENLRLRAASHSASNS